MYRTVLLQTEATNSKRIALREFEYEATACINWILSRRASLGKPRVSLKELWVLVSKAAKDSTGFNSQVVCDLVRFATKFKGKKVDGVTVRFNIPRNILYQTYFGRHTWVRRKQIIDRKASVAIAVKALLERNPSPNQSWFQISGRRVPVMALVRSSDEAPAGYEAVPAAAADESPRF